MRRKRLAAGEVRFRVSKDDLKRIDDLMTLDDHQSVSSLIRTLIREEYDRLVNLREIKKHGSKEKVR